MMCDYDILHDKKRPIQLKTPLLYQIQQGRDLNFYDGHEQIYWF